MIERFKTLSFQLAVCSALMTLPAFTAFAPSMAFTAQALPLEALSNTEHNPAGTLTALIARAEREVKTQPPQSQKTSYIAIAVSLSIPKASLLRLAEDARDAGIALSFRGVGETVEAKMTEDGKIPTVIERYGSQLLKRHLASLDFLRETGVTIRIDPMLFQKAAIDRVPQVLLIDEGAGVGLGASHCADDFALQTTKGVTTSGASLASPVCPVSSMSERTVAARAVGDVTLAFALRQMADDLQAKLKQEPENARLLRHLETVHEALKPLGERQ